MEGMWNCTNCEIEKNHHNWHLNYHSIAIMNDIDGKRPTCDECGKAMRMGQLPSEEAIELSEEEPNEIHVRSINK